jgi:ATP-dependent Clp protease ATP-binding subunit ClpA
MSGSTAPEPSHACMLCAVTTLSLLSALLTTRNQILSKLFQRIRRQDIGMKDNELPNTHHVTTSYFFGRPTGVGTCGQTRTDVIRV